MEGKLKWNRPSKNKESKTTKHSSCVSFDSFLFVDNVTNSRIALKDVRKHYQTTKKPTKISLQQQKQVNNLEQCLTTLKSTKLFQMDSLRNKLFKSTHIDKQSSRKDILQTKQQLRSLIQTSIKQLSIQQFRQCLASPNHRVQPKIIALQSLSGHKLTKENIEALLQGKQNKSSPSTNKLSKQPRPIIKTEDGNIDDFKQEKDLLQQGNNYLKNSIKNNVSYLIKPKYNRQLYDRLYEACSRKNEKKVLNKSKIVKNIQSYGVFQVMEKPPIIRQIEKKLKKTSRKMQQGSKQKKQLIFAVQNNLFFDVQTLISMKKQLITVEDDKGNNLLHIAAKNRNNELFNFLLRRAGLNALNAKNNLGRTPIQLARLYGASGIVKLCENYSPYSNDDDE